MAGAIKRLAQGFSNYLSNSVDRRLAYARMRQKYFVDYDYSVKPFEPPLDKKDPYEGEDLVNIDVMETLDDER